MWYRRGYDCLFHFREGGIKKHLGKMPIPFHIGGGDAAGEAYTAIAWGALLSLEIGYIARTELVGCSEGEMCGIARQDAVAAPGSKTASRAKGDRRNLGDLVSGRAAGAAPVRIGKARSRRQ
jgi:hypothetical protein